MSGTPTDADRVAAWLRERDLLLYSREHIADFVALLDAVRAEAIEAAQVPLCIGWTTIERLRIEGAIKFDDGRALVAADDLFHCEPLWNSRTPPPEWECSYHRTVEAERDTALEQLAEAHALLDTRGVATGFHTGERPVRKLPLKNRMDLATRELVDLKALLAQREAECTDAKLRAAIAETAQAKREAEVGALRECATSVLHQVRAALPPDLRGPILSNALGQLDDAVDDTAATALAYATTLKAEGAREERERCAHIAETTPVTDSAAATAMRIVQRIGDKSLD